MFQVAPCDDAGLILRVSLELLRQVQSGLRLQRLGQSHAEHRVSGPGDEIFNASSDQRTDRTGTPYVTLETILKNEILIISGLARTHDAISPSAYAMSALNHKFPLCGLANVTLLLEEMHENNLDQIGSWWCCPCTIQGFNLLIAGTILRLTVSSRF